MDVEKKITQDSERIQLQMNDIIKLELLGLAKSSPGWQSKVHLHDFWELIIIIKEKPDTNTLWLDGTQYENFDSTTIYLIPPSKEHYYINSGTLPNQNLYVGFSYLSTNEKDDFPLIIQRDIAVITSIAAEFRGIVNTLEQSPSASLNDRRLDIMNAVIRLIWHLILRKSKDDQDMDNQRITAMKEYIQTNIDSNINIGDMAEEFFISSNYLGQLFRQATGTTVKNYHNQLRMEKAMEMLLTKDYTANSVALTLGFSDSAYFSRRFKEYYGVSPSKIISGDIDESFMSRMW